MKLNQADKLRIENWYLSMFCAAMANYKPSMSVTKMKDIEERDEAYRDDLLDFAEDVAENGLAHMIDKFGGKSSTPMDLGTPKTRGKKPSKKRSRHEEEE